MSELIMTDNGTIRPLGSGERWRAAVTVCDEAPDAERAAYALQALGLIAPAPDGGYVPIDTGGDGATWYPPSPFTRPYVKAPSVFVRG